MYAPSLAKHQVHSIAFLSACIVIERVDFTKGGDEPPMPLAREPTLTSTFVSFAPSSLAFSSHKALKRWQVHAAVSGRGVDGRSAQRTENKCWTMGQA